MKHLPLLLLLLLVSCRGTQTVVSSTSDTTAKVKIVRDTVRIETTRWRTEWKTLVRTDTVWRWRTDSAAVSEKQSTVKETQNRPSRTRLFLLGIALIMLGVFLIIYLYCFKK